MLFLLVLFLVLGCIGIFLFKHFLHRHTLHQLQRQRFQREVEEKINGNIVMDISPDATPMKCKAPKYSTRKESVSDDDVSRECRHAGKKWTTTLARSEKDSEWSWMLLRNAVLHKKNGFGLSPIPELVEETVEVQVAAEPEGKVDGMFVPRLLAVVNQLKISGYSLVPGSSSGSFEDGV